ncbi:type IX secretion system membrane protein PorP/SprF [bacterium]|nr:type IX secretion system membrane protein PorP/SprF [bacterium]
MKTLSTIVVLCAFSLLAKAQVPHPNMFYENFSWQNPAFTALSVKRNIMLHNQLQSFGSGLFNNVLLLNYETRTNYGALGVNYFGDYYDNNQQHALQLNYALPIKLSDDLSLSAGASVGAFGWRYDSGLQIGSGTHLVWNTGLAIKGSRFTVGISQGVKANTDKAGQTSIYIDFAQKLNEDWDLLPTLYWLLPAQNLKPQNNIGARFRYHNSLELGAFRTSANGLSLSVAATVSIGANQYRIGYSMSNLGNKYYRFPAQEFLLAMQLK